MLPVLERLLYRSKRVLVTRVLVLTPTRELAAQIHDQTQKMAKHTDIKSCLIVGGMSIQVQEAALRAKPDILVATPGRMIDHIRNTHSVHVDDLEILVSSCV
jgi:ATP-dependent RNA helicase DDX27